MMWYFISTFVYGILSALDPLLFVFIAYTLNNVSGVYMGVLSAAWSIVYIIANKFLGSLADDGHNKLLCVITLICVSVIAYFFNSINYVIGFLIYILHAVAIASLNLAINVTILESFDSDFWNKMTLYNRVANNIVRGATLIMASMFGATLIVNLFHAVLLGAAISGFLMPSLIMSFERRFYKLNKMLDRIGHYIKASSSLLYLDKPKTALDVFMKVWNSAENISSIRVLITTAGAVAVGDYIFTVIPLVLKSKIILTDMWKVYGVAAVASALISFLLRNTDFSSRFLAFSLFLLRLAVLVMGFNLVSNVTYLVLYILTTSTIFMLLDSTLYNIYIEARSGFGTSTYFIFRELGSVIGSLLGGLAISLGPYQFLAIVLAMGLATSVPLIL